MPDQDSRVRAASRDLGIDTMRGIAILMVIGIHSLPQPLHSWETLADACLRPCVPIFLFASGYLTALSGRVPLGKRLKAAAIPYAIAFVAAYVYMALHNPAMDHRIATTLARFVLGYVFVYYYVFVYVGCTLGLWLVYAAAGTDTEQSERRLIVFLLLAIGLGLVVGSYLDPLLARLGYSDSLGDAADYDSVAFFGYAALLCVLLLAFDVQLPFVAGLGSGSYFIYLWHIFIVMVLRDYAELRQFGAVANFAITYIVTASGSILALLAVREIAPPRMIRWLGA
jgi:peptidoglycan/LPS O-acetylase OafA/YrhL